MALPLILGSIVVGLISYAVAFRFVALMRSVSNCESRPRRLTLGVFGYFGFVGVVLAPVFAANAFLDLGALSRSGLEGDLLVVACGALAVGPGFWYALVRNEDVLRSIGRQ